MKANTIINSLVLFAAAGLIFTSCTQVKVRMATAPLWFFRTENSSPYASAACTAVNLHDHSIELRTELIYHVDNFLPYPIGPETLYPLVETHTVQPHEATVVKSNGTSLDNHLVRCLFDYKGDAGKVKGAIIIENPNSGRSLSLPAEIVFAE